MAFGRDAGWALPNGFSERTPTTAMTGARQAARFFSRLSALPGMTSAIPFLATAVLLLPLVGVGLVLTVGKVTTGSYRAYPVLAINHLITLGWGTLTAMGAIYQLFPAMIGTSVRPGREVPRQFVLYGLGVIVLVGGFLLSQVGWIAAGGILTWTGAILFAALVLRQVRQRQRWSLPATGIVLSLGYLTLAVTWGLLMGLNWRWTFWARLLTLAGLGVHVALGVGGWFVQLIVSASYYLLPRFVGVRDFGTSWLGTILVVLNAGILIVVTAAFTGSGLLTRLGVAFLVLAGLLYAWDLERLLGRSQRTKPDLTISTGGRSGPRPLACRSWQVRG